MQGVFGGAELLVHVSISTFNRCAHPAPCSLRALLFVCSLSLEVSVSVGAGHQCPWYTPVTQRCWTPCHHAQHGSQRQHPSAFPTMNPRRIPKNSRA